jgi:3-oxoacyl-[acyl-carrier protein] reductase
MRLEGKVAIVTGAASGFGRGIAERFAEEGAKVVIADLDGEAAERVADAIGGDALGVKVDVSDGDAVAALVEGTSARFGRIDIVVNNAGTTHRNRPMLEVDEATYDRIFAVNVKAIYHMAQAVIPVFRAQGTGGAIINTASTAGLRPRPGLVWYNASRGAAISLTKSMAVELAPEQIRVNCLCPVAGDTPMLGLFMGEDTPELRAKFVASIPIGRLSQPADMANAALWLASDEAAFITGVALEVDGGRCI